MECLDLFRVLLLQYGVQDARLSRHRAENILPLYQAFHDEREILL